MSSRRAQCAKPVGLQRGADEEDRPCPRLPLSQRVYGRDGEPHKPTGIAATFDIVVTEDICLIFLQHHVIREKRLSEKETLVIFYNVVKIVERLHARNVVHRDLKLGNVSSAILKSVSSI